LKNTRLVIIEYLLTRGLDLYFSLKSGVKEDKNSNKKGTQPEP
jgi:hypothetical protein